MIDWFLILRIAVIIGAIYFLIVVLKPLRIFLTVVIGLVYMPLNNFHMKVQKWYFSMRHKDEVIYWCFTPFYWILVGITFLISVPYEFLIAVDLH